LATELGEVENLGDFVVKYLNRLSDFLFVAARYANKTDGRDDIIWKP
jgi:cob(I)alamin adenosyltransferase